ncbi:MAG: carboxypeptidase-like regulatory domain-containing protein [Flavobacteriaceae bacterium]
MNGYILGFIFLLVFSPLTLHAQNNIPISGKVMDDKGFEIPYAAIGIVSKNIGTTSTEDGTFYFQISAAELKDTLSFSSLGFSTYKLPVSKLVQNEKMVIILEEKTTSLREVVVNSTSFYVRQALKKLKVNTLNKNHELDLLYRRWSVEDNVCRFLIEQNIKAIDRGPSSYLNKFFIENTRTSADYRFVKNEQKLHALKYMEYNNPLRKGLNLNSYKWETIGDSSYDDEDVMIVQGVISGEETITLYIGLDSSKIYKLEMEKKPKIGKSLKATYIYKNNKANKLYLSYHQREWKGASKLSENVRRAMISASKTPPVYIPIAYRHEVYVLNLVEDKSKFKTGESVSNLDMSNYESNYDVQFWESLSIPPETNFYRKNVEELEGIYNVPLEDQFKYANRKR